MIAHRKQSGWQSSPLFHEAGSEGIRRWNRERLLAPRCGAKRRSDGGICQQPAMANGRCHWHGGSTPRGDEWHRTKWPDKKSPGAEEKMFLKLRKLELNARQLRQRLLAMSPEERETYESWRATHTPGSSAARRIRREDRAQAREFRAFVERGASPREPSDEVKEFQRRIDELKGQLEERRATHAIADLEDAINEGVGVFG
jgi:hypothetical protein